jgi:hypothetical protein
MATTLTDDIRHEAVRGLILTILVQRNLEWVPFPELKVQMARRQGSSLTDSDLWLQLRYLAGGAYVETRNPRPGRSDLSLLQVRAMSKALDLVNGRLEPDKGIAL